MRRAREQPYNLEPQHAAIGAQLVRTVFHERRQQRRAARTQQLSTLDLLRYWQAIRRGRRAVR